MSLSSRAPYLDAVEKSINEYQAGNSTGHSILCGYCRYFHVTPATIYDPAEAECEHPLDAVVDHSDRAWEGGDCWGFRPTAKARAEVLNAAT
jgi:hypothetical protein